MNDLVIQQRDGAGLRELALFAGAGGGILGSELLGDRVVCAVERDAYAAQVLVQRQNDGTLRPFPIWSDVTSFDGRLWAGRVDIISGGFPCQGISSAGLGAGLADERSGLWREMRRIISEVRPDFVRVENSPMLTSRGLDVVLADLAALGFDAEWGVLGAREAGAPHKRERIWILATDPKRVQEREKPCDRPVGRMGGQQQPVAWWQSNWEDELARLRGMGNGLARAVDRTDAIRNGQVPIVAAAAWEILR